MSNTYQRLRDREAEREMEVYKGISRLPKREFKQENRYLVFKLKDIRNLLSKTEYDILQLVAYKMDRIKPMKNCVVVEDDWGIYQDVWDLVEQEYNNNK